MKGNIPRAVGRVINTCVHPLGLSVQRKKTTEQGERVPPIFDDPLEAFYYHTGRDGQPAGFWLPIADMVKMQGFRYPPCGYEPSTISIMEYESGRHAEYEGSHIKQWFTEWQWKPKNFKEALLGIRCRSNLEKLEPHVFILPWDSIDLSKRRRQIEDHRRQQAQAFGFHKSSLSDQAELGRLEYTRCVAVFNSIKRDGYDRNQGDVNVTMLQRGNERKFLLTGGGNHRTVAMAALGAGKIPARHHGYPKIIYPEHVDYWPQVRRGLWERETALEYFNHLFDFDSRAWAKERGLLMED